MGRFSHDLFVCLLGYRGFLLWLAFLFYVMDDKYAIFPLLLVVLVSAMSVLFFLFDVLSARGWIALILADLSASAMLIAKTGQWTSPFLLYGVSGLLWLGTYVRDFRMVSAIILFLTSCLVLPRYVTSDRILSKDALILLHFLQLVATCTCAYFLFVHVAQSGRQLYRMLILLFWYLKRLAESKHREEISRLTERLIKRMTGAERAYLCWLDRQGANRDSKRYYYAAELAQVGDLNERPFPVKWTVMSEVGKQESYYAWPIRTGETNLGVLLLSVDRSEEIGPVHLTILRLLSLAVCNQVKRMDEKWETEAAMRTDLLNKLAQDMHDGLAQQLFFLSARLFNLKQKLAPAMTGEVAVEFGSLVEQVNQCHLEVRGMIHHLRNEASCRLFDAVRSLLQRMTAASGISLRYTTKGQPALENLPVEEAIYRLVEEASYNVLKHARATILDVYIEVSAVQWTVHIKDNGIGFTPEEVRKGDGHYGLAGMKERVHRFGGSISIRSAPGKGTEIIAMIPREGEKSDA